eukprot:7387226-Prymnesium_polylepis.1
MDHDEQAALQFVMGGKRDECSQVLSAANGCLVLNSTANFDIVPGDVMNTGIFDYKPGVTLVLHFWEFQCNIAVYEALQNYSSWLHSHNASKHNTTNKGCLEVGHKPYLMQYFATKVAR